MGTLVTIHVVRPGAERIIDQAIDRAFGWFHEIEARCTRFDPHSELMQLTAQAGVPVPASPILYEAVRFALMVAEESGGAFDPTVGHHMEARGFNREHRTGEIVRTAITPDDDVSYRDVQLDPDRGTILLRRPLIARPGRRGEGARHRYGRARTRAVPRFRHRCRRRSVPGRIEPARRSVVGRAFAHPRHDHELIDSLRVSNQAVCTSGDYERGTHILDPRRRTPANTVASATVVASSAMLADALATAAFVLGPEEGIPFLTRLGVEGLIVTPDLKRYETRGLCRAA